MKKILSLFKKYLPELLFTMLLFIAFLLFYAVRWYIKVYGDIGFDAILYTIFSSLSGVESGLVIDLIKSVLVPSILWPILILLFLFSGITGKIIKRLDGKPVLQKRLTTISVIMLTIIMLINAASTVGLIDYVNNIVHKTKIFETAYVDPNKVDITFPEEKRNLIYIYLESMETTYFSKDEGGALEVNIIPELYELAQKNINFSQNSTVGGFEPVSGTTWTVGALVGQTAGIPLKTPKDVTDMHNGYGKAGEFLPGVTNLSDILHENGYVQSFMVGSNSGFGGRRTYYKKHHTDYIYDLITAKNEGIVPHDYFVWWGIEDKYLFSYAKDKITEMSQAEEPFAFTMLTVDTHHIGGYVCESCGNDHEEQYENVISCSSRQVAEFVQWIQEQDFYDNTTVIICGDHPSMDRQYMVRNVDEDYNRLVYNCFLNAAADGTYSKNRAFCTLDMFPTTLAAMGCRIEGERLGLGTNLFSGEQTLIEQMGFHEFNSQIGMKSEYYSREFLMEQ